MVVKVTAIFGLFQTSKNRSLSIGESYCEGTTGVMVLRRLL